MKPSLVEDGASPPPQTGAVADPYISKSVFRALATVFASRLLILLALLGAFTLAVMAMVAGTPLSLYTLIAYCVLTIGPLVALDLLSRR